MRDGVLFFIPGLYLFVLTDRPVLLGTYLALLAAVQTVAFWVYKDTARGRRSQRSLSL
ncbi:MAG: hypothetical protein M0Z36_08055 [Thermaerobacter sp.]|nr:hypothetical protein [Thermaerobacter sp.]